MNAFKKVTNKISNSKIIKNPVFLVIGLIAIILVIALIYFIFLKYSPIMNFKYEGYAISGKDITENLLGASENTNKNIELTKIEEQGTIFKKLNDYFVGSKEKTEINLNYPIYINNNSAIYNLAENNTLISKDFEEIAGYPNLSISEGKVYDGNNLERADAKEYIFVKTTDEIYINLYEIQIKTTANEYTIPVNSILAFTENSIRYYTVNNNVLVFNQINDVDSNSSVQMVENSYTYEELLTRLGILQNETTDTENTQTDIIQENTASDNNTNDNENIESENEETNPENSTDTTQEQSGYIRPEVTVEDFTAEVYTAKSILTIKDPAGRIVEAPTFEIYKDGKIYLRRTFNKSGEIQITGLVPETEYKIVGKYVYLNENGQKVENTFYEESFTTKGYEELGSIDIQKENGEIFSNKIQLTKVKITSDLNAEVIKGINQVEIETGDIRTVLKNSQVNELLQGKEITIESSEGLKSDSKINYVIKVYDKNGIELKVNNNTGETRTSKEAPVARISIKEQDIVSVTLGLKLTNRDDVELENYKYIVTRANGEIVQEERLAENETELLLENLDQNQYYKISIYADYDLNDNRGKQENVEIGNLVFATQPISTLGSLELIVENRELTSTTSTISYKIDEDRTDKRLIQILNELTINIKDGENIVKTDILLGEEISNLQQAGTKEIKYENLQSNTTYTIEIIGNVQLGNTEESIPITYNYKEFTTLKIPAKVEIRNQFVTGNLIDFDVRIEDINNSVLNNKVRMELRNSSNDLIDLQELTTNEDYIRKTFEKLEENQTYKLSFYADQYNEGSTDETYKVNFLIKEMEIVTEPGISGSIGLTELTRKATGKNLVDVSSETKWYVYPNFNTNDYYGKEYNKETKTLTLGGHGNYRRAVYDLREYAGQEVTMSFKARNVNGSQNTYIQNSKTDTNRTKIEGLTEEWKDFQYTLTVDSTGYLGFYIAGGNGIEIKELQIELGNKKTSYEEFKYTLASNYSINLEDKRDEITTNDYYIKVYEDNTLIKTDRYEEIPEENVITNTIKIYDTQTRKQYKVELVIKIKDREYILSGLEYNTQDTEEIKGIYNKEDFLEIQQRGHYIVLGDIDLTGGSGNQYRFGNTGLSFEGTINFNGHTLTKDAKNNSSYTIIEYIGENGVIENLVFNIKLNKEIESGARGFCNTNYGNIKNISINIIEATNLPHRDWYLLCFNNYGSIENFVVNLQVPIYLQRALNLITYYNMGTIKNGYVYGENIKAIYPQSSGSYRDIGVIAMVNQNQGVIKNIYNLVNIELDAPQTSYDAISNILRNAQQQSVLKNVYSVGTGDMTGVLRGPNVLDTNSKTSNSYYFSDIIFNTSDDMKTTPLVLYDSAFQNQVLNEDGAFEVDDLVGQGYYPHIKWPDCMPAQDYVSLPEVEDADLPDLLSTTVIEQGTESAKVKFVINNPSAETITNIVIQNLNCTIESQEYKDGKSEVIAILDNPVICTSNYSLEKISTKGVFNAEYSRTYALNERIVPIELYREIHTIDDWKGIKQSPTENYILMEDLDFRNEGNSIYISGTYSGKFNGNNNTIRNIFITHSSAALLWSLSGTLCNLNIENYTHNYTANGGGYYTGLISVSNETAILDNIHINDINIEIEGNSNYYMIGGIIGNTNSSIIRNCSVSNMNVNSIVEARDLKVGGIVGNNNSSLMQNSYAQNIEFNIYNSPTASVGGLAGNGSKIYSSYAVGNIYTDANYTGGIAGYAGTVENCYSYVNIESENNKVAGILGHDTNTAQNNIINNLSLGNIYSKSNDGNIFRITDDINSQNYAYFRQKINGFIQDNDEQVTLLDDEDLKNEKIYINQIRLGASYDYSKVKEGILPKLYDTNGIGLLPNQIDNTISENANLQVNDIQYEKTNSNSAEIRIEVRNPNNFEITNIKIEDMETNIADIRSSNGITYITATGTPERYYDSYKLENIIYKDQNIVKTEEVNAKIELQFFKELYSYNDWQSIEEGTYQNYRLMQDIDFTGRNDIKTNVTIGRLESEGYAIKNMNVKLDNASEGIIGSITLSLQGVTFDNITIENNNSVSYVGVIINNTAKINNVTFKNINLLTPKSSYIGMIANNSSDEISNINLNEINITGKDNIGGLIPDLAGNVVDLIVADRITIQATASQIGGVIGTNSTGTLTNVNATNISITGNEKVGGIIGSSTYGVAKLEHIEISNSNISGNNIVGGICGNMPNAASYLTAINITVSGNDQIGGLNGQKAGAINYAKIEESTVTGINQVGGITGYSKDGNFLTIYVKDTNIYSTGDNCGGITGESNSTSDIQNVIVDKSNISGNKVIGGIVGLSNRAAIHKAYVNATITGNEIIGGIVGYLDNEGMTVANKRSMIYHTYVISEYIGGQLKVGGIIGNIATDLYMPESFYYSNYVQADIESEDSSSISLGIGGRADQNQYLKDTYYYKYSSLNGENPNENNEIFIPNNKYLVADELKQQTTYTSKLKWYTSDWDFNALNENKYPTLKVDYLSDQEGVNLPKDSEHIVGNEVDTNSLENEMLTEELEQTFEYDNKEIVTYSTYSVITSSDGSKVTRNAKLYVKDNSLYAIPTVLSADKQDNAIVPVTNNLILDSYNGKEYETVLGSDGKIYDLKEPISYPENFVNSDIESIGNNLNSDVKEVEVTYKNEDKIKFNYQTGEIISSSEANSEKTGLFDYLKTKISEIGNSNSEVSQEITTKYEESKELQTKLEETSVEEAIEKQNIAKSDEGTEGVTTTENNATNNSLQENKYISMYNEETGQYEIYNEEELLDTTKEEVVSENEKIEANNLSEYYASEGETRNTKMGIVWIVISIIGVGIILFVLRKNLKKKNA